MGGSRNGTQGQKANRFSVHLTDITIFQVETDLPRCIAAQAAIE
jgi:hypothetical protein